MLLAGIDEIKGINKYSAAQREKEVVYHDPHARKRRRSSAQASTPGATAAQNDSVREKPQKHFEDKIDNSHAPFVPKFERNNTGGSAAASTATAAEHPFAAEIAGLRYMPAQLQIAPGEERKYLPLDSVPCTWVDTEDQLRDVVNKLRAPDVLEIAIDLEAHNYRSFQGFVCLMQLSTRDEDWLVDTLALRSHMQLLSPVFTDATKVKVLHGADSDIVWLQRDFGLHIVNMFDTGQASRVLGLQRFSLAFLYKQYCNVDADKQYQLADWRIRPLSEEMAHYAREDTHYLLYVYDLLRLQLLEAGPDQLQAVLDRSAAVALRTYNKPAYDKNTYRRELAKRAERLSATSEVVFARLHEWRDETARKFDESWPYVLPSYVLFRIAEQIPLSEAALSDVARPLPPLVQHHAKEVVLMLQQVVAGVSDPAAAGERGQEQESDAALRTHVGDGQLAPGQLTDIELYLLSSTSGPRQAHRETATVPQEKQEHVNASGWFQHLATQPGPALFGLCSNSGGSHDETAKSSSKPPPATTAAMTTVQEVLGSFESLDDMAKALLEEFTGARTTAEAEAKAEEEAETAAAQQLQQQQAAAMAGALLGTGAVNPVVSVEGGDEMMLAMNKKAKAKATGDGDAMLVSSSSTVDDDDNDDDNAEEESFDPTALPASIADKYDVRSSSSSKRRKGKSKASRHKRRRAAEGAATAAAAVSQQAPALEGEGESAVFRPFTTATEEPSYDESGAKTKGVRKKLQSRSHMMSSN